MYINKKCQVQNAIFTLFVDTVYSFPVLFAFLSFFCTFSMTTTTTSFCICVDGDVDDDARSSTIFFLAFNASSVTFPFGWNCVFVSVLERRFVSMFYFRNSRVCFHFVSKSFALWAFVIFWCFFSGFSFRLLVFITKTANSICRIRRYEQFLTNKSVLCHKRINFNKIKYVRVSLQHVQCFES